MKPEHYKDMAYGNSQDMTGTTTSDKVSRDKAFNIAKKKKKNADRYQHGLASLVYKFSNKKFNW